jgi:tetratricopeptide (TPR) repeat protein
MLGVLYMATKASKRGGATAQSVAEISQLPAARFQLAEYYLNVGRNEEATKLLTELAADQATFADAEAMLASIDYDGGRREEAHARLDKLLARAPKDARALVIKARWLSDENKLDEALDRAKAASRQIRSRRRRSTPLAWCTTCVVKCRTPSRPITKSCD